MKSTAAASKNSQSSPGKKMPSAGISNRPPAREEQEQRQLPPRGQAKKSSPHQQRSGSAAKDR